MPLTVSQLVALPELALAVHTASVPLDREVRWVAVSEHADPRPWIAEGDLMLTTGLTLDVSKAGATAYVERLAAAGVAALGLGTGDGLSHAEVPPSLVAASEVAGLPLFEVPEPVPFVAISKAVSRLLAAQEYAEVGAAFDSQRRLLRTVLARSAADPGEVLRVVARHVGGFALLLDADARVVAAAPESAADRAPGLADEIERLRPRGLLGSASVATDAEHISVLPVGVHGSADAFLAVGSPRALRSADQGVLTLAVSLLARPEPPAQRQDAWRRLLVRHAWAAGLPEELLPALGLPRLVAAHAAAVCVRVDPTSADTAPDLAAAHADLVLAPIGHAGWEGFAAVAEDGTLPASLERLAGASGVRSVGVSAPRDLREPSNVAQALAQAAEAAHGPGLRRAGSAGPASLVDLLDAASAEQWARTYAGPLIGSSEGAELMDTAYAWLEQHGQVDAAAHHLGIHRHTVRHRLRRAEAVLGRSLEDPQVRADLWSALVVLRR